MSFLLTKLLPPLIYPVGLVCLLLLLTVLVRRRPHLVAAVAVLALVVLYLASNRWVSMALMRSLEWRYLPQGDLPAAEAIVVLGGGTYAAEAPRPIAEVGEAGDRMIYAARLYQLGKAPYVLVSGGNMPWVTSSAGTPADDMTALLAMMGVPAEAVWRQEVSQNTYEDAVYCAEVLREHGVGRVLLVTSASHMPRSVALFRKQGVDVIPAPADFTVSFEDWERLRTTSLDGQLVYLLPDAFYLSTTYRALHEYYGLATYKLRGWID
ncbi:MAG: YdcF family protein [Anaerolineae bacterium]